MTTWAIRTTALTREFQSVRALDGLELQVKAGSVFGFLGPNGAGKTTTLRLLLGLIRPTRGSAEVLGLDCATEGQRIRERCGALLEHHGLYERLSAYDNLEFQGRATGMSAADRKARARELLEHVGLWDRRGDLAGTFSRGMKQKLAVARAIFHRPALVFLDEPSAGLDPEARVAFREDLRGLVSAEGMTVMLTTHDLVEAEKVCAQVGILRKGKLLQVGTPAELRARASSPSVELVGRGFTDALCAQLQALPEVTGLERRPEGVLLSLRPNAEVGPLVSLAVRAGAEVSETRRSNGSLEEAYLAVMEESR